MPGKTRQILWLLQQRIQGQTEKQDLDDIIPSILEPEGSSKAFRKNWARLIQKIYETDPLCCPKLSGKMKILSFIEDPEVIKKILKHLGLWDIKARPLPKATATPPDFHIDYSARPGATPLHFAG